MVSSLALGRDQKTSFRFGSFFGSEGSHSELQQNNNNVVTIDKKVGGFVGEINHPITSAFNMGLQVGYMAEQGTFLGSQTSGAFATDKQTPTWFSSVAAEYAITPHTRFFATYSQGFSQPQVAQGSLLENFSAVKSNSFSLGVTCTSCLKADDKIGFTVSQPLRIFEGGSDIRLATGTDVDGNIYYDTRRLNLSPSGRELDAQAFYGVDITKKFSIGTSLMYRNEPEHVRDAQGEGVLLFKTQYKW